MQNQSRPMNSEIFPFDFIFIERSLQYANFTQFSNLKSSESEHFPLDEFGHDIIPDSSGKVTFPFSSESARSMSHRMNYQSNPISTMDSS
jgi:hypothetical protein